MNFKPFIFWVLAWNVILFFFNLQQNQGNRFLPCNSCGGQWSHTQPDTWKDIARSGKSVFEQTYILLVWHIKCYWHMWHMTRYYQRLKRMWCLKKTCFIVAHKKRYRPMWHMKSYCLRWAFGIWTDILLKRLACSFVPSIGGSIIRAKYPWFWEQEGAGVWETDNQRLSQPLMIPQLETGWYGKQDASAWSKVKLGNQPSNLQKN